MISSRETTPPVGFAGDGDAYGEGLEHLLFLANGTVALQVAIRACELAGEVITTPFSYVATTSSIAWEHCQPVMVDIDPDTLNIDPARIEAAITPRTTGILATHVFGNPCRVEEIEAIARRHHLKVIYDAAHAFGTLYKGQSLLAHGDVSTCSFHATKLFHTIEGGLVVCPDAETLRRMALLRNFGHSSQTEFDGIGINGKKADPPERLTEVLAKQGHGLTESQRRQIITAAKADGTDPNLAIANASRHGFFSDYYSKKGNFG